MFDILNEKFEVHNELNPLIWNGDKLRPEVHDKILEIVQQFKDIFDTPISIVDIQLCGSNCSYNYHPDSDLDIHIIARFDDVCGDENIMQALYNLEKSSFNDSFDISIHGIEVELYIQDINSTVVSNGIYSVTDNKWIKYPKPIVSVPQYDLTNEIAQWTTTAQQAINSNNKNKIDELINQLYKIRQQGIAANGEWSRGNQLFKELRSLGILQSLKDAKDQAISSDLTLENYNKKEFSWDESNNILFGD